MCLFASIDIGANTLRLLIGKFEDNIISDIHYLRRITRLGSGVIQSGKLSPERMDASLSALKEFSSIISGSNVKHIRAVATSALREASNARFFIEKVFKETGITIEVISGEEEANFTLKGLLGSFSGTNLLKKTLFIVDIGGGSTEWILYRDERAISKDSIPIGVVKLNEDYIKSDPVSKDEIAKIKDNITPFLEDIKNKTGIYLDEQTIFVGTAGTFTTIASIDLGLETYSREKVHLHRIPLERLQSIYNEASQLTLEERKRIKGLEPERADLIIPGLVFTINIMDFFKFEELIVSDYGLLEGILFDMKEQIERGF